MKTNQFAVIGLGELGVTIARKLTARGAEVLAIDKRQQIIDHIADDVTVAVCLDATDKRALESQNIFDYDAVLIAIGDDFENTLLCATLLQELGVGRIIIRAKGEIRKKVLERMGYLEIFYPEEEVSEVMADRLFNRDIISSMRLPGHFTVVEVTAPDKTIRKTIGTIKFHDQYRVSLIAIKDKAERVPDQSGNQPGSNVVPTSKTIIREGDILILYGRETDIKRFIEVNN